MPYFDAHSGEIAAVGRALARGTTIQGFPSGDQATTELPAGIRTPVARADWLTRLSVFL